MFCSQKLEGFYVSFDVQIKGISFMFWFRKLEGFSLCFGEMGVSYVLVNTKLQGFSLCFCGSLCFGKQKYKDFRYVLV